MHSFRILGTWLPVQLIRFIVKERIIDGISKLFTDDGNQTAVIEIRNNVVLRTISRIRWYATARMEWNCNGYRSFRPACIFIQPFLTILILGA
jgi:hypothetical protein